MLEYIVFGAVIVVVVAYLLIKNKQTKNNDEISTRKIEGAHFESNNEYVLKMYYRDPLNLCDRILSYKVVKNS